MRGGEGLEPSIRFVAFAPLFSLEVGFPAQDDLQKGLAFEPNWSGSTDIPGAKGA
jgi:hypothetical protein